MWASWEIKDKEFLNALEEFADLNFIDSSDQTSIPKWFKQNTKWYLDETISEKEFMNAVKYLIKSY